jgi:arylsulfatase A-like enzyme
MSQPVGLLDLMPTLLADMGLRQGAGAAGRPIDPVARQLDDGPEYLPGTTHSPEPVPDARHVRDEDLTAKALAAMGYL